ncbi:MULTISPECIES: hypothetical protein [Bacillaceae]|uniref:hypothetical protein n=1 Tax=Bacillaceae TaxID=186817 RepID=UPI001E42F47B|nr:MULTISPECIES: hypothetical protein [Bacillaceae]MCE4049286.1 hypothetical protein [Bacillus sp. Au-Bac7]MCM3033600.1 hypothetical protein [Niallia sp. MER 6]UPO90292.1 hypothetical protein L8T27_019660 [Niallia sp. Man26]
MNLKKSQEYVSLEIRDWNNTNFAATLYEICDSHRTYSNDQIEVHQVVKLGKINKEWRFVIILNITQDLDNLGTLIEGLG